MPKRPAFPVLRDAMKKKKTRREVFLSEMEAVVPWGWSAPIFIEVQRCPPVSNEGTPQTLINSLGNA
jgi:hypothetical protein